MQFKNRIDASEKLATQLLKRHLQNPLLLALPRGGVPIAYNIGKKMNWPIDVIVARKLGAPGNEEFGIGAISENDSVILDDSTIDLLSIKQRQLAQIIAREEDELQRRVNLYRQGKPLPSLSDFSVVIIDDGLATGITAKAAITSVNKLNPESIVFASPACANDSAKELESLVDGLICLITPKDFMSVGLWYQEFEQVSDDEVISYLSKSHQLTKTT